MAPNHRNPLRWQPLERELRDALGPQERRRAILRSTGASRNEGCDPGIDGASRSGSLPLNTSQSARLS
jgi:hypothetical protein